MAKLIITKGLPASGKSTWAREQKGFCVVEKDAIRKDLETTGWKWSHENERDVIKNQEGRISFLLEQGVNVIAADTNFGKHENRLKQLAQRCGASFAVRDFTEVPLQTCVERNAKRKGTPEFVPEDAIVNMYKKYVAPQYVVGENKGIPYVVVDGLPWCVLCDLDGTLAIHNGRSPYDTAKCGEDLLNENVYKVLFALARQGNEITFCSGREDKFRAETERWLTYVAGISNRPLLMRKAGDYRNDAVVKVELFDEHIRGKYNVVCVLDDRDRVVKAWRDLGLCCLQVNYGNF